jgi:hypothetical protein
MLTGTARVGMLLNLGFRFLPGCGTLAHEQAKSQTDAQRKSFLIGYGVSQEKQHLSRYQRKILFFKRICLVIRILAPVLATAWILWRMNRIG